MSVSKICYLCHQQIAETINDVEKHTDSSLTPYHMQCYVKFLAESNSQRSDYKINSQRIEINLDKSQGVVSNYVVNKFENNPYYADAEGDILDKKSHKRSSSETNRPVRKMRKGPFVTPKRFLPYTQVIDELTNSLKKCEIKDNFESKIN